MQAEQLLNELTIQGFSVKLSGESLEVSGGKLTDQQRQAIRDHKPTLCGLLKPEARDDSYIAAEREAIQQEREATDADMEFPAFEGVKQGQVPEGWTVTEWQPASLAPSTTPYYDKLFADMQRQNPQGIHDIARCKGKCRKCPSDEAYLQVIHEGQALRLDCARCGSFIDFPVFGVLFEQLAQSVHNGETPRG